MNTQTTTEKQILENNQLIRQFMGLSPKPQSPDVYSYSDGIFYSVRGSIEECIEGMNKYVKYHTSWDWLMPVVEKIHNISITDKIKCYVGIINKACRITTEGIGCNHPKNKYYYHKTTDGTSTIDAVHQAVVQFIQWYNTEKAEPETYIIGDDTINGVPIDDRVRQEELHEYSITHKESLIDNLCMWIAECTTNDKNLMKDDLQMLMGISDEYILSSNSTNSYIHSESAELAETCKEILEINANLNKA